MEGEGNTEEKRSPGPVTLMWREFAGNTTLHGLRYAFLKRPKWIRALWLLLIFTAAGYYSVIVVNAVQKFLSRPMNTIIKTEYANEMDFPAVTICPLSQFSLKKLRLRDSDEEFVKEGFINMSECVATAGVRGGKACGVALACCCVGLGAAEVSSLFPECTGQYRQQLISALKEQNVAPNVHEIVLRFAPPIHDILPKPFCSFGKLWTQCSSDDFDATVIVDAGVCFTFNSGNQKPVKRAKYYGTINGLFLMLNTRDTEFVGQFSRGFKVIAHNQGEYVDVWSGINVPPGFHSTVLISRKEV